MGVAAAAEPLRNREGGRGGKPKSGDLPVSADKFFTSIKEDREREDEEICLRALDMMDLRKLKDRSFLSLSGGEKQRIYMAAAFAQQSRVIILDEPTNHLDIGYQLHLMETLRKLQDVTIFTSVHDISLAARYCDRILVLENGRIAAQERPRGILTRELIRRVFHVETEIVEGGNGAGLQIHYLNYCGDTPEETQKDG